MPDYRKRIEAALRETEALYRDAAAAGRTSAMHLYAGQASGLRLALSKLDDQ